jgi:hypothetical protein
LLPHPLDLIALILGVLAALRNLETSGRRAEEYPSVDKAAFERWKTSAQSAYRLGISACFGKVLVDIVVSWLLRVHPLPFFAQVAVGVSLDLVWVALMIVAFVRWRRSHAIAREIGLERARREPPASAGA